jgi:hypothetical protein
MKDQLICARAVFSLLECCSWLASWRPWRAWGAGFFRTVLEYQSVPREKARLATRFWGRKSIFDKAAPDRRLPLPISGKDLEVTG